MSGQRLLIAVDIGNSSISIGYFTPEELLVQNIPTRPLLTGEEYAGLINAFIKENNIEIQGYAGIISSVVSGHTSVVLRAVERLSEGHTAGILTVDHKLSGLDFRIENPHLLGTDRMADAVAAFSICRRAAAVVNFGTATTITVIDDSGSYIGGSIMAGIGLMNQALGSGTSGLAGIDIKAPGSALGTDTEGCIAAGLFIGTAGAVERIIEEIAKETGLELEMVLTGGYCSIIGPFMRRPYRLLPRLTLEGLRMIYDKNRP